MSPPAGDHKGRPYISGVPLPEGYLAALGRRGGCPHPPAGGHKGRPYTEARSAREQGNSETRRRKSSCAAGARCFLRRDEQLPVAEGAQRDREARRVGA